MPWAVALFGELRRMSEVRRFKLVFLLEAPDHRKARQELVEVLELVTARGFLDFLDSPPTIRTTGPRHVGWF